MKRTATIRLLTIAALSVGLIDVAAQAEDWKPVGQVGYLGTGKAYEISKDHLYWVGQFAGTFFSDKEKGLLDRAGILCPAWQEIDIANKKTTFAGQCTLSDLDGDKAYLTFKGTGAPGIGIRSPGTFEWTGGTGKYQAIKGDNTFYAVTTANWADGSVSGYAPWNK